MSSKHLKETDNTDKESEKQEEEVHRLFSDVSSEKPVKEKPGTIKQGATPKSSEKKREISYTFQDMPESSKESLKIVYHKPVYNLPIPTNPKYKKLSIEERAHLLDNYYKKINSVETRLAKLSVYRAPYSKLILPSNKCKNSLSKNPDEEEFFEESMDQISSQEFYVSRAGRQVKRKIYKEDTENDNDSDSDFASLIKKNRSAINSDTKITMDTPCVVEEKHNENNTKTGKLKKDTPKRTFKKKLPRSEEMFENLIREGENIIKKQQETDNFEKSLFSMDDDEKMFMDESPIKTTSKTEKHEKSVKNQTALPVLNNSTSKSKQEEFNNEELVPATPPDSPILHPYMSFNKKRNHLMKIGENSFSEEETKEIKRDCPLCGKEFPQSKIEDHAANCGNELENNTLPLLKTKNDTPRPSKVNSFLASEEIYENFLTDEERPKQTNLSTVNEANEMIDEDSPIKENLQEKSDESFIKRRVIPPKPNSRRGPKPKKQTQKDFDRIEVMTSPSSSSTLKHPDNVNKITTKQEQKPVPLKDYQEENERDCPICGKQFPQTEIEDHAANCENFKINDLQKTDEIRSDQIKCELCDRIFKKNTDYEVHVKQCIAEKITNM